MFAFVLTETWNLKYNYPCTVPTIWVIRSFFAKSCLYSEPLNLGMGGGQSTLDVTGQLAGQQCGCLTTTKKADKLYEIMIEEDCIFMNKKFTNYCRAKKDKKNR